ncbi:hypothetical protein DFH09DRAFT_1082573 [Mycena vulgaris]|nr:hypothetical protein DFH09DRAFT_1082573 [Mycena vulgaris]
MTSSNRLVFAGQSGFTAISAVFRTSVTQDLRNMYSCEAHRIKDATWFFAGSIKDLAFIEKFYAGDLRDGEILPAGVVFDLNHPGDGLVRRELTPPSLFTPRPRNPRPQPQGEKRKRRESKTGPAVGPS